MRLLPTLLAVIALAGACSKAQTNSTAANVTTANAASAGDVAAAAAPSDAPVSGVYEAGGQTAQLTEVTAHKDDPFNGQPVTALVFTSQPQGDDPNAAMDALFGKLGDAMIVRVESDGTVIGADLVHHGLANHNVSVAGVLKLTDYSAAGGEIAGHLSSGGPADVFDQKVTVDLTFHAKAP